jgi:hypothetical protein
LERLMLAFVERKTITLDLQDAQYIVSAQGESLRLPPTALTDSTLRLELNSEGKGEGIVRSGVHSGVLLRFGRVLAKYGERLQRCHGSKCRRFFIRRRSDALHCSYNCYQRHFMAERKTQKMSKKRSTR